MRVFVAGATGAIGRMLVPQLLDAGHEVVGMTRSEAGANALRRAGAEAVVADVYDAPALQRALNGARPEVVIDQLTDLGGSPTSRKTYAANDRMRLEGSANLVAAARAARVERFLAQSVAFFAAPGAGKADEDAPLAIDSPLASAVRAVLALEARVRELGGTVLRYGLLYGPGTWYAPDGKIAAQVKARRYPIVGHGGAAGTFVHVEDAARATVAALERAGSGTFHVVADESPAVRDWLPAYAAALDAPRPRRVPSFLARLVAGSAGVWYLTKLRPASNARAKRELGFVPRPLTTPADT